MPGFRLFPNKRLSIARPVRYLLQSEAVAATWRARFEPTGTDVRRYSKALQSGRENERIAHLRSRESSTQSSISDRRRSSRWPRKMAIDFDRLAKSSPRFPAATGLSTAPRGRSSGEIRRAKSNSIEAVFAVAIHVARRLDDRLPVNRRNCVARAALLRTPCPRRISATKFRRRQLNHRFVAEVHSTLHRCRRALVDLHQIINPASQSQLD